MKIYKGEEIKELLGVSSVVNAYMILASLGISSKLSTRYGEIHRLSETEFKINFLRKPELEDKMTEQLELNKQKREIYEPIRTEKDTKLF
jgi:hypothetical protein